MAPNGMMQVWSGLLLRVENEAQLASILGHEMGHYVERHSLERWEQAKASLTLGQVAGIGLALAGAGGLSALPNLIALASIFAYNREQEREADEFG